MSYSATPILVRLPVWRARFVIVLFLLGFVAVAGRSGYLQAIRTAFLKEEGEARYARVIDVAATRGRILDRNGEALAISTPVKSVWAMPEELEADRRQRAALARVLDMPLETLERKLAEGKGRDFVYLKRQLPPETARRVAELKLPGVFEHHEFRRYYPGGEVTAHVVGFTGVDDVGQEGMELAYERQLAGRSGSRRVIKDRLGRIVEDDWLREPVDGRDLSLSIDSRVQYIAFSALRSAIEKHQAKAGAAIVLDARTGEVLALVNLPTFDPNVRGRLSGEAIRNRVLTDTFEPGSTMKPFAIATALEQGKVRPETRIQTAPGHLTIGGRTIGDAHPHGVLTVEEVVAKSSNVGTAKIALDLPPQTLWETYTAFGFGQAPRMAFPGAVAGRLRPAKTWRPIEQATISYGHGVSVSLVQLAHAYSALARDGDLMPLSLTKLDEPPAGVRVLSAQTAAALRKMLEMAVSDAGTAPAARIAGYRVAGKTGTAYKLKDGQYVKEYVASFVGFAPASDPRLVIAVMIDEPGGGAYYGGQVAAPVFAQIAGASLRTLQVPPDGQLESPTQLLALGQAR